MSTAANHRKRSHYTAYRSRGFSSSRTRIPGGGTPTIKGFGLKQLISMIRRVTTAKKSHTERKADEI